MRRFRGRRGRSMRRGRGRRRGGFKRRGRGGTRRLRIGYRM